jgi:ribosome-associated protein
MQFNEIKQLVITTIEDMKGENIVELDVKGKTSVTDLMILVTGTSSRHVKSIAENVFSEVKKAGMQPLGMEGEIDGEWVLVDLGDIVVHVMQPQVREFYDLEKLWSFDAKDKQARSAG